MVIRDCQNCIYVKNENKIFLFIAAKINKIKKKSIFDLIKFKW